MIKALKTINMIFSLSWRIDRRRLVISLALLLGGSLAQPAAAIFIRDLTNEALHNSPTFVIVALAVAVALSLVGQLLLAHLSHLWYFELGELDEVELNQVVSKAIHNDQPMDTIESPSVADALDLLRQDVLRIRTTLDAIFLLGAVVLQLVATCILLTTVSPLLLVLLAAAGVPAWLTSAAEGAVQRARETTAAHARQAKHLRDVSTQAETLKEARLGAGAKKLRALHDEAQRSLEAGMRAGYRRYVVIRQLGQLPFALSLVGAISYTALLSRSGNANAGQLVMVLALTTQIGGQVTRALQYLNTVSVASSGLQRVEQLANEGLEPDQVEQIAVDSSSLQFGIRFERVSYKYPGAEKAVLEDVSLDIPAGTSVALVGENGAGKSTLIKLVLGLYKPTQGRILIDGTPLENFTSDSWSDATAALFQDFLHFDFRVGETIGFGDVNHINDADRIFSAADRSGARQLVENVGGLNTYLGHSYRDGRELSGGQWQTIGLARTLMKPSPLVLTLDEPGHSLDPEFELRMIEAYEQAAAEYARRSHAIAFYVTHRLSSVRSAGIVIVLRSGKIDARGTHRELMEQGGYYSTLFALQASAYD